MNDQLSLPRRWYSGITGYQWLVLVLASLGWVFDVFEGQLFVAGMKEATPAVVSGTPGPGEIRFYDNVILAAFLLGGAAGGVFFGMLSDRIGRKPAMMFTILFYSLFTSLSAFSQTWWQLAGFRFLVALATFWGTHIYGKDKMAEAVERSLLSPGESVKHAEMLGMLLVTIGGGLGLLSLGPFSDLVGRRSAFLVFLLGGLAASLILFPFAHTQEMLYLLLPVFGFLTLGMHAGCAVYFPELFPTRLRGTGVGFCFNVGRLLAAPILVVTGWLDRERKLTHDTTAVLLSSLFLVGVAVLFFAPETRGKDLPE